LLGSDIWRSSRPITVVLIRHGEAFKNLQDRHGGGDPRLTAAGRAQCLSIRRHLDDEGLVGRSRALVLCHEAAQVLETVRACDLAKVASVEHCNGLRAISLGELSGLSRTEAATRYPAAAARLEGWRAGTVRLSDLDLPGGEDASHFVGRVVECVRPRAISNVGTFSTVIVVGTRSILIALHNSLALDDRFSFSRYEPWEFSNGSVTRWDLTPSARPQLRYFDHIPSDVDSTTARPGV
jgi:broad specificity phosphatase PhoE